MRSILVTNSKGGSGKSTICSTLAGALANKGYRVTLVDADVQGSAGEWLKRRSVYRPHIDYLKWDIASDKLPQCPRKTDFALIDSPSGIDTLNVVKHMLHIAYVIVPVMAALYDQVATRKFLYSFARDDNVQSHCTKFLPLGSRVRPRSRAQKDLTEFMNAIGFPLVATISERVKYAQLAAEGQSIFDANSKELITMQNQWQPLLDKVLEGN